MEKKNDILKPTAKAFTNAELGGKKSDKELATLDRGILEVALMIAGLDGTIFPEEYDAFAAMAKKCRGATAANTKAVYDSATAKAGQIVAMARSGLYSEAARLATFVKLAHDALPNGFACGSLADLRRAFALWIAMGVSDGAFSAFERRCVNMLVRRFALARAAKTKRFAPILESDFLMKAVKIFSEMEDAKKRKNAEQSLTELIAFVPVKTKSGLVPHPSAALKLAAPLPGPTVPGWK